eukprot:832732-Lingulodinium_polyedra.AAC.1
MFFVSPTVVGGALRLWVQPCVSRALSGMDAGAGHSNAAAQYLQACCARSPQSGENRSSPPHG